MASSRLFAQKSQAAVETEPKSDQSTLNVTSKDGWIDHEEFAVSKTLYEDLGLLAFVTGYCSRNEDSIKEFISDDSFRLGDQIYSYGPRESIIDELDHKNDYLLKSGQLQSQLQRLASSENPSTHSVTEIKDKNENVIYTYITNKPVVFAPLYFTKDLESKDHCALRIYPFLQKGEQGADLKKFKAFTFEFFILGLSLEGKTQWGNTTPVFNPLTVGDEIIFTLPPETNVLEEVQFAALETQVLMMSKLGRARFKVFCNLHFVEEIFRLFLLYFSKKISAFAVHQAIKYLLDRKSIITQRLKLFFADYHINFSFLSSLDSIIDGSEVFQSNDYFIYFLNHLDLTAKSPHALEDHEKDLIKVCESLIKAGTMYPIQQEVWADFYEIIRDKHIPIRTLESFFELADAVTLRLATEQSNRYNIKSCEVCSIQSSTRMHIQQMLNFLTFRWNEKYPEKTRYVVSKVGRLRSPVSFTHSSQQLKPVSTRSYPAIFNIGVMNQAIGSSIEVGSVQDPGKYFGDLYRFIDTKNKQALTTMRGTLFNQAAKNAAVNQTSPEFKPLEAVLKIK